MNDDLLDTNNIEALPNTKKDTPIVENTIYDDFYPI